MSVEITFRHTSAAPELNDYANDKATELAADFPRVEHVHVILETQKHHHIAEVVVRAKKHIHAEAKETSDRMRTSLDEAFEKVARQLRRSRDKVQNHKGAMGLSEQERSLGIEA